MQKSVLLSIKPEFVEKIFEGTKEYEFRRVLFKDEGVKKVVIYASSPIKMVVGEFEIEEVLSLDKDTLWEKTKDKSGIKHEFYEQYFSGANIANAIKIGIVKKYKKAIDLIKLTNSTKPPQSFMYLHGKPEQEKF